MISTEPSLKPPQISEMFQKFALAFKTKTIEFFAEDDTECDDAFNNNHNDLSLLDSTDEIITGQRVVVIKPDHNKTPLPLSQNNNDNPQTLQNITSSLFATISSFKASYLHLQTAHAPFDADAIQAADRAAVSHLQRLSEMKRSYQDFLKNPNPSPNFPFASCLAAQVEENQSLLRTFDMVINRLQSDIDRKDGEVSALKQQLESIEESNLRLSKRLEIFDSASSSEVLLSVGLFDSVLQDACMAAHSFTKTLIDLMKNAGWDLGSAANSVYPGIEYAKRGHNRYAFLSYVCLAMFGGFDTPSFGLGGSEIAADLSIPRKKFLREFVEHGSADAMELLSRNPDCNFARFCEMKYQNLIHPNMESSLFSNLDDNELVLNSWRSSSPFYESFVSMASVVWMLHKLAFSFDPTVGIFQVGRGADFSMVYMENVARRGVLVNPGGGKARAKVGFTVIPGFRVGKTVIQCQVYQNAMKSIE
ncbi:protein GRAVITROPIC IN THE LIGHT 1 [Magnolia sinica]|uniref:protein GRAVITROPIC IN THE LIGHT 1 n=1 Tax=Magnolia sinica TaxID=86752 RepID=UPI0026595552|nr:protein GRAVITROPIC IN THE LIGHT 1 [Magnolia sinica]